MARNNTSIHFLQLIITIIILSSGFQSLKTLKLGSCKTDLNMSCSESERNALLDLKDGLTDPSGRLSSWVVGEDCCKWAGVICSNRTGRVIKLKLRNPHPTDPDDYDYDYGGEDTVSAALGGKISPSLQSLKELRYLDLSMNKFGATPIPDFIGSSLVNLKYLNLSDASFGGTIPPSLGKLSKLRYLDLESFFNESIPNDLKWLSGLSSLEYLNLGNVDLSKAADDWLRMVNMLPSLSELHLPLCGLSTIPPSLPFINFTSLSVLDLSNNGFNSSIPHWLFNLSSLVYLDLSFNSLESELTDDFGRLTSLQHVDLSENYFIGGKLSKAWGSLCNLRKLYLSKNNIGGEITEFIDGLSVCTNANIESLDLGYNKVGGFLPNSLGRLKSLRFLQLTENSIVGSIPQSIGNLSSLEMLYLTNNQMKGPIPESLGQLSSLTALDISGNSWDGVVTEAHFSNLTSLKELYISKLNSPNITLVFNVSSTWIPPFKLTMLTLRTCQLGPKFPSWLRTQNELSALIIVNTNIADTIPDWFSKLDLKLNEMDFSKNQLRGRVPNSFQFLDNGNVDFSSNLLEGPLPLFSSNVTLLYLRDNLFSGPIPHDIGKRMPNLANFDVSYNSLNGTIPLSIGELWGLTNIVLSNNYLTGEIPPIWYDKPTVYIVDFSNNRLSGKIPVSMGLLTRVMFLVLSGNNFSGEIPSSLKNCTMVESLDLGDNRLSGTIPAWIGEQMPSLLTLRLRSNLFHGYIPSQLCRLSLLHILDLAENDLSGAIPSCIGNLSGMASDLGNVRYEGQLEVATKGREYLYANTLYLVNSIDLSSNRLTGEVPQELKNLSRLGTFNLSANHLTGKIPEDIASLSRLETLDLSRNQMSGSIPPSMVSLTALNHLNLSYNNFSGRIPTSNQFQTLIDPSIYMNNSALCGRPLTSKCPGDDEHSDSPTENGEDDEDEEDDDSEKFWFYISIGPGFAVGFWAVCGTLIVKKSWRLAYFKFFDDSKDWLLLRIALCVKDLQRKLKPERT